jgi:hypothetical protein
MGEFPTWPGLADIPFDPAGGLVGAALGLLAAGIAWGLERGVTWLWRRLRNRRSPNPEGEKES